jgi:ubiquinone/menaquinone biosynthesis C-methylase UbiE
MATVFMKWLETSPEDYERGIQILTLGRLGDLKQTIARQYVSAGDNVLEIGCGTGTLALLMAENGANVVGIDASPAMLEEAQTKIAQREMGDRITLKFLDASQVADEFQPASFDLIVSTLVFSEIPYDEQRFVLEACRRLLVPGGRLLIADEVIPRSRLTRILYSMIRLPLVLVTWLLTRTTTRALRDFECLLVESGFTCQTPFVYLKGSLVLFEAVPTSESIPVPSELASQAAGSSAPVLVTGNYDLTVRRLVRDIDGQLDTWVMVVDSAGINVWCAAGGGYLTAEKVIGALKSTRLEDIVEHRLLILPQLCANGVDGWKVRDVTGWGVHWGPVRAADIPAYLHASNKKDDQMRWVCFPLKDRLEMVTVTLGFYGLLILLPILIFWRHLFWPVAASLIGLSYFYAVVLPWLPGRDGLQKSISLSLIGVFGLLVYTWIWYPMPPQQLFNLSLGLIALSVFTAAELQGMSPLMRGEQANWGWEVLIGVVLLSIYLVAPFALGWR